MYEDCMTNACSSDILMLVRKEKADFLKSKNRHHENTC